MKYTKHQLKTAMYLLLNDVLPHMGCQKVRYEGNWKCDRCDDCMFDQYIKKAKLNLNANKDIKEIIINQVGDKIMIPTKDIEKYFK